MVNQTPSDRDELAQFVTIERVRELRQVLLTRSQENDPWLRWMQVPTLSAIFTSAKKNPAEFLETYHRLVIDKP